jgi:N-acetylmuramoyl-L-alanine amidase
MKRRLVIIASCVMLSLIGIWQMQHHLETQETFSNVMVKYGSTGADVKELQGRLKYLGFYNGSVDGDYGWKTLNSVKWFQWEFGMKADGIVAAKTKLKLWEATKKWSPEMTMDKPAASTSSAAKGTGGGSSGLTTSNNLGLSENDLNMMANAVYGEARGESFLGQVAVAAVILNRVKSPSFPDTINGVIFEPRAFTAVADGQIWLTPNETAKKAVRDALNGHDPTGGCIYYFNPDTATSAWIWTRPQVKQIGKHIFCK